MTITDEYEILEKKLSADLLEMRDDAIEKFSIIAGKPSSLHQMHAHIGRNNNSFVDSVRMQFKSPEDFLARWLKGLSEKLTESIQSIKRRKQYSDKKHTIELVSEMIQDDFLEKYIYMFLERNFYRNYVARIRAKPNEVLWQLWFGSGNLVWGLIISPKLRFGEWTNDKSEMRREEYAYWTIGHVLKAGLIAPGSDKPVSFSNIDDFIQFYETVLARISNSNYELQLTERYVKYLRCAPKPNDVPLLIPELRYEGKEKNHKYRLDFTVLNPYTMKMIGFEISPSSSHMSVSGKNKKLVEHNKSLSDKWDKESDKRNLYFSKYGITTVTFTDTHLKNIDACFDEIVLNLEERKDIQEVSIFDAKKALIDVYETVMF